MRERILAVIEKNSRISVKELADLLGENEAAVAAEIAEMENEHIICSYHTLINWDNTDEEKVIALIEVKVTDNTQDIFLVTKKGMCIRFKETDVRVTGRVSMGVIGMRFDEDDEVIGMQMESQGEHLLVVSENGMGKRTLISEFNAQIRGGKGVLCYKVTEKTGYLIGAKLVNDGREIMLITTEGIVIRMSVDDISVIGRNTSGVKLMNIDQESDIKVASIAKVRESATRDNEAEEEELEEAEDNTAETEENDTEE